MIEIHPHVQDLIRSLDPTREYVITRDLVPHEIIRQGQLRPGSPVAFYDKETGREVGLAFGGGLDDYIRVNTDDIRHLQAAVHDGHADNVTTGQTLRSLNDAAEVRPRSQKEIE